MTTPLEVAVDYLHMYRTRQEKVRRLHENRDGHCRDCMAEWPCPTVQILDGLSEHVPDDVDWQDLASGDIEP